MSYALGSTTDIGTLLTNVKEELGLINSTSYDFFLRRLITEASNEIFSLDMTEQRQEILTIEDKSVKLPCEFLMFNKGYGWRFVWDDCTYSDWYQPIASNGAFFKNNRNCGMWDSVQRIGEFLYFDHLSIDAPRKIEISGLFVKCNEDGSPYIPKINTRPIVAYACYKFIRANMRNPQWGFNGVQMADFKQEWVNGKIYVTARSKMPDAMDKQVLRRLWNAKLG